MTVIRIEQVLLSGQGGQFHILARSPGFDDGWLKSLHEICTRFGDNPPGSRFPGCLLAQPLAIRQVAVIQVADGNSLTPLQAGLAFHALVLPKRDYDLIGDPFVMIERFGAPRQAGGELPSLTLTEEDIPVRTLEDVRNILKRREGPLLLGAAQAVVDGARLVFERPGPEPELLAGLWLLLPSSTRSHLWPATFALNNALSFDVVVARARPGDEYFGYMTEVQAAEYPEGAYERGLQIAAETGDEGELAALWARRSRAQTFRLGIFLLVAVVCLAFAMRLFNASLHPPPGPPRSTPHAKSAPGTP
jgi:hypothetical protein